MLEKLEELVRKSDDEDVELMLDRAGIEYTEIEEDYWIQDGKYQYNHFIAKIGEQYFTFNQSRSGSPFTDWYYTIDSVNEIDKFEGTRTVTFIIKDSEDSVQFANDIQRFAGEHSEDLDVDFTINESYDKGWD
tara:strand:+ start:18706 stop:19104 length:399 start_codon:yes stop_codon:yes gene_type:complete